MISIFEILLCIHLKIKLFCLILQYLGCTFCFDRLMEVLLPQKTLNFGNSQVIERMCGSGSQE